MEQEYSTKELKKEFGIPPRLANRWGPRLQEAGVARHIEAGAGANGYWLYKAAAVPFLKSRVGRMGRPPAKIEIGGI